MVDRHHRLRALLDWTPRFGMGLRDCGTSSQRSPGGADLSGREGWLASWMVGATGHGNQLPGSSDLDDDPYRSLVWKLKKEGLIKPQPSFRITNSAGGPGCAAGLCLPSVPGVWNQPWRQPAAWCALLLPQAWPVGAEQRPLISDAGADRSGADPTLDLAGQLRVGSSSPPARSRTSPWCDPCHRRCRRCREDPSPGASGHAHLPD